MTTQQEPARVDVIPLVTRGQPKAHDLPEPIAHASGHPRSDLLVCVGAESHRLYVIDLDGRKRLRTMEMPGLTRIEAAGLVVGRTIAALAAQAKQPLALVALDDAPSPAEVAAASIAAFAGTAPARPAAAADDHDDDAPPKQSTLSEPDFLTPAPGAAPAGTRPSGGSSLGDAFPPVEPGSPGASSPGDAFPPSPPAPAEVRPSTPPSAPPASPPVAPARTEARPSGAAALSSAPLGFMPTGARASLSRQAAVGAPVSAVAPAADAGRWRDEVVTWSRAAFAGAPREAPAVPPLDAVAARFELSPPQRRALLLLYGAHLCGEPGAAPVDVARVCDRSWDEALGRGRLAEARLAIYERSRVRLSAPIQRALDELPPAAGVLVGTPGTPALLAPWAALAPADEPLTELAARLAAQIGGSILAARPGAEPAELYLEARARGAVPLLRLPAGAEPPPSDQPAILAVDDDAAAERLGAPIL
jgi:hypothetical protein